MTKTVSVHEAKTHLSRLLELVADGDDIVIAKSGRPVARLVSIQAAEPRRPGLAQGRVTDAFFEPLPEEELAGWEQ